MRRHLKIKVECSWCFWNGNRQKKHYHVRCPKCRKSHTVELLDPNKEYAEEERIRHRKIKMFEAGAKEIRPNVWISKRLKIYSDKKMTKLREFDDYYLLYKLLTKEAVGLYNRWALFKGKKFIQIGGSFIKVSQKRKR